MLYLYAGGVPFLKIIMVDTIATIMQSLRDRMFNGLAGDSSRWSE
jgi:hypothetical protein